MGCPNAQAERQRQVPNQKSGPGRRRIGRMEEAFQLKRRKKTDRRRWLPSPSRVLAHFRSAPDNRGTSGMLSALPPAFQSRFVLLPLPSGDIGHPKLFMVGKASAAERWPRLTVNNFVAARGAPIRMANRVHLPLSVNRFSRPGGPGLLTYSRFNDFEFYRPARRAGLGPLTTTPEGAAILQDDSSILASPGQACGKPNR